MLSHPKFKCIICICLTICLHAIFLHSLSYSKDTDSISSQLQKKYNQIVGDIFSDNVIKRDKAYNFIKKHKPLKIINVIILKVQSDNRETRKRALKALKQYPKTFILNRWIALLNKTTSIPLKIHIIDYLSDTNDRRLVVPLTKYLRSSFRKIRMKAAIALKKNGDDRMYPFILDMSSDKNPIYRIYALEALNKLFDRRFYPVIKRMVKDTNKSVRIYALKCMKKNNLNKMILIIRDIALNDKNDEVRIGVI